MTHPEVMPKRSDAGTALKMVHSRGEALTALQTMPPGVRPAAGAPDWQVNTTAAALVWDSRMSEAERTVSTAVKDLLTFAPELLR